MNLKAQISILVNYYLRGILGYFMIFQNAGRFFFCKVILKESRQYILYLRHSFTQGKRIGFQVDGIFHGGHFSAVFLRREYGLLNVHSSSVIDVGAANGDTAIFFYLNGAKKVVAVEPNVMAFEALRRNISINHLESFIIPMNMAIGGTSDTITIDPSVKPSLVNTIQRADVGIQIRIGVLEECLKGLEAPIVLKMDCEGCEFDAIGNCSLEILSRFDQILMEFHKDPRLIVSKLQLAGFNVSYDHSASIGYLHGINTHSQSR